MSYNTPFENIGTSKVWDHKEGDNYLVTGVDRNGKKFRFVYDNWPQARGINLWKGYKWLVRNGARYLINRVSN